MNEATIPTKYEKRGPGKYGDNVDEWVCEQALDGCCPTLGDAETFGHFTFVVFEPDEAQAFHALRDDDGLPLWSTAPVAAVVSLNSQGFAGVVYFGDIDEAEADWVKLEEDWTAFNGPDPFDPE